MLSARPQAVVYSMERQKYLRMINSVLKLRLWERYWTSLWMAGRSLQRGRHLCILLSNDTENLCLHLAKQQRALVL